MSANQAKAIAKALEFLELIGRTLVTNRAIEKKRLEAVQALQGAIAESTQA